MKKIIIILILTLTTFLGENIYTNTKDQNEYMENFVEIVDDLPDNTQNLLENSQENETINFDEIAQESNGNSGIKEEQHIEENVEVNFTTPKEENIIEQPKVQKVQEQKQVSQPKEEPRVVETKTEPIQEPEPATPKCSGTNHGVGVGNSNKWFNSKQEAISYYDSLIKTWGDKWESFEIDSATYDKNCPYGYEVWTCPFCGKWTINFYYR